MLEVTQAFMEYVTIQRDDYVSEEEKKEGYEKDTNSPQKKIFTRAHLIEWLADHYLLSYLSKQQIGWIALQWLPQRQRFCFDLTVVDSIIDDIIAEDILFDDPENPAPPQFSFWDQMKLILSFSKSSKSSKLPTTTTTSRGRSSSQRRTSIPIHIVQAGQNVAWDESPSTMQRLTGMQRVYAPPHLTHHVLANAGHWVHTDDLPGLLHIFTTIHDDTIQ
jgi:hypothetical protein